MNLQTVVVAVAFGAAALYLGRELWRQLQSFWRKPEEGCGSGCGKCAFAEPQGAAKLVRKETLKSNIIPLNEVRKK